MVTSVLKLEMLASGKKSYDKTRQCIKKQRHNFANKVSLSYSFSSSHLWICYLDHKIGWALKNWCFRILLLVKALESHLDSKEVKQVNPKGNEPWTNELIGRTDTEVEAPILWLLDANGCLTEKDHDTEKNWRKKKVAENELIE